MKKRIFILVSLGLISLLLSNDSFTKGGSMVYAGAPENINDSEPMPAIVNQGQLQQLSNPISANAITIDGLFDDWATSIVSYPHDTTGDNGGGGHIDWEMISIAHDCDELYVRQVVTDGPPFLPYGYRYNVFLDTDRSRLTGFTGAGGQLAIGADILIQGGHINGVARVIVFKFTGANQEIWSWGEINYYPANDQELSGTRRDIEWSILLADLGAGPTGFDWVAFADNASSVFDFYPDSGNSGAGGDYYTYTFTYPDTPALSANPERGFYHHTETHSNNYTPLGLDRLRCYHQHEQISLISRIFYLEAFVNSDISPAYLAAMQADFETVRQAGLKMIIRFAYTNGPDLLPPYGDTSKAWMLRHIEQMADMLQANSDVIAVAQAGLIGLWGEWWYSDYFQPDGDWDARREVLIALLDALSSRMVQLRTPRYKQNILNTTVPISPAEAHSGTYLASTGHHNDCALSSENDYGTYIDLPNEYIYLEEDTKWVAVGGETCIPNFPGDPDPDRLKCAAALAELARLHWSYLNIDWYRPTLQQWRDSGCFEEIASRLGYRFILLGGTYDDQAQPGGAFHFSLQIENTGFAALFNPRLVELVLRNKDDGSIYIIELPDDPRFWLAGETHTINHKISLPSHLPTGKYDIFLNLPDPEPGLHDRPEYSIRLEGAPNLWESETGFNRLNHTLIVKSEVLIDIKPGSEPNCFNNNDHGVIPVAILSSAVFDATQVDPATISLDGQGVRVVGKGNTQAHEEDVNDDGLIDLIVQIEDVDGTYEEGDAIATLSGETFEGILIEGTDSICIVP